MRGNKGLNNLRVAMALGLLASMPVSAHAEEPTPDNGPPEPDYPNRQQRRQAQRRAAKTSRKAPQ